MNERRGNVVTWLMLAASAALWMLGLRHVGPSQLGSYGLLAALPLTWYAGFIGAVATATGLAVTADRSSRMAFCASLALLVLIIHGTPAIVYSLPRYTWTFKHVGVIDVINARHSAPRSADIYFNWPGFFTAADTLHQITGLSLMTMAKWPPPAFEALITAAVLYFARAVATDRRVISLTAVLYLLANWVGQDYFAPQALAFALALMLVGAMVRLARTYSTDARGTTRRTLLTVVILSWVAILTSHQLTPVVVLLDVGAIFLLSRGGVSLPSLRGGGLLFGAMVLSEVAWVLLALPYLRKSGYPLFSINPLAGSSSTARVSSIPSLGLQMRSYSVDVLYFGLFAAGGLWGLATLRKRRGNRLTLALAAAPALVLLVQNYGGEGQLRTYLFAVPFLSLLVADALMSAPRRSLMRAGAAAAVAGMAACFLFAYYGQEEVNIVGKSDLATVGWFYAHAPAGTAPVYLAPDTPSRLTQAYLNYPLASDALPTLLSNPAFAQSLSPASAVGFLRSLARPTYLIVTPSQARYLDYFGIASRQRYASLLRGFRRQPGLELLYAQGGGFIWRLRPRASQTGLRAFVTAPGDPGHA